MTNEENRSVSSESEELILVDKDDNELGFLSKARCHDGGGVLHRAFSLFLFNDRGELLLQKRSDGKRLWPGFWSNSCCSHPRRGESMETATMRRLSDELNVESSLEFVYRFCYSAKFSEASSENELCHVYLGRLLDEARPNESEISSVRFVAPGSLAKELSQFPEQFTPWFKQEWRELVTKHSEQLLVFCNGI